MLPLRLVLLCALATLPAGGLAQSIAPVLSLAPAQPPRLVLIDQDGSGPAGSNQMAMMVLLQSPAVKVLGITEVSGNAWEPEEVAHTLRMLELIGRSDVPVVPGAVFPLVRTQQEWQLEQSQSGAFDWYGAWGDLAAKTSGQPYHPPFVVPPLAEGQPTTAPLDEDAAHFLIRQVHAHPHQVTIYAAGPLTNIALALAIDPQLAELTAGIRIMGGSLAPQTADPEFATDPRHEFNFWFDPEAAHIVLRAPWPRIDLTDVDISVKTMFTQAMLDEIAKSPNPAARYLAKFTTDRYYMWDELAAAAWIDPSIITREMILYIDVDTTRGATYGDTLSWTWRRPGPKSPCSPSARADGPGPREIQPHVRGPDESPAAKALAPVSWYSESSHPELNRHAARIHELDPASQEVSIVCQSCGNPAAEGAFCSRCGAPAQAGPPNPALPQNPYPGYGAPPMAYEPRVQRHIQTLGILWIVYGVYRALGGIVAAAILMGLSIPGAFGNWGGMHGSPIPFMPHFPLMGLIGVMIAIATGVFSVLSFLVGYALLNRKPWGRVLAIGVGHPAAHQNLQFGTALAILHAVGAGLVRHRARSTTPSPTAPDRS